MNAAFSCKPGETKNNITNQSRLVGTWRLIDYSDFDTVTNKWTHPYGDHPKGYFTYTNSGIVNMNGSAENPLVISADSEYTKVGWVLPVMGQVGKRELSLGADGFSAQAGSLPERIHVLPST